MGDVLGAAACGVEIQASSTDEQTTGIAELEPDFGVVAEEQEDPPSVTAESVDATDVLQRVITSLSSCLNGAQETASVEVAALQKCGLHQLSEDHLFQQLMKPHHERASLPPVLARGAAHIVAKSFGQAGSQNSSSSSSTRQMSPVAPLWPTMQTQNEHGNEAALERWGYKDTRFVGQWIDGRQAIKVTSMRYGKIGGRPLHRLWSFFQSEFAVAMNVRDTLPERSLPDPPAPAEGLVERLTNALSEESVHVDA